MNGIKTMAMEITEETWPIAVACLPAGFARIPKDRVLRHILVINEICVQYKFKKNRSRKPLGLKIDNAYVSKDFFDRNFTMTGRLKKNQFVPVEQIH
jgi:hypothetical protein